jgi:hypothetical protein
MVTWQWEFPELNGGFNGKVVYKSALFHENIFDCRRLPQNPGLKASFPQAKNGIYIISFGNSQIIHVKLIAISISHE